MVNAPVAARERGIDVAETVHDRPSEYQTLVRITIETDKLTRSVAGTLFAGTRPRLVEIKGIPVEADFAPHMLYVTNQDKPGLHRPVRRDAGRTRGSTSPPSTSAARPRAAMRSASFRSTSAVPEDVLAMVRTLPLVVQATALAF